MGKSNYYDNIAHLYDQTRWLTEAVAEEVANFILQLVSATPETSFLEPGVGTGLNVLPFVKRGYAVTGIDISSEMLDQFRQKLHPIPQNLTLLQGDASQLPFSDDSFDVVLTVHMLHTVLNWQIFLNEIDRVLKPQGFYLNAQWITPPARMEFEQFFKKIAFRTEERQVSPTEQGNANEIKVEEYLQSKGYQSNYLIAKEWTVGNTVEELLSYFKSKAYGLCWRMPDAQFQKIMDEFESFCLQHYGSLATELSSNAKFEIWAYTAH
jgi:ubiquinone/menaquinone biosynthesis C-methylase UbiE